MHPSSKYVLCEQHKRVQQKDAYHSPAKQFITTTIFEILTCIVFQDIIIWFIYQCLPFLPSFGDGLVWLHYLIIYLNRPIHHLLTTGTIPTFQPHSPMTGDSWTEVGELWFIWPCRPYSLLLSEGSFTFIFHYMGPRYIIHYVPFSARENLRQAHRTKKISQIDSKDAERPIMASHFLSLFS